MAITRSTAAQRVRHQHEEAGPGGGRGVERGLLLAASVLVAVGLFFTFRAKTADFDALHAQLESGALVDLNAVERSEALLPHLSIFDDADDRRFAGEQIAAYLKAPGAPSRRTLPNVGALGTLRVPAVTIEGATGLDVYARRLAEAQERWQQFGTPEARQSLALLTGYELAQIKDQFVVRTPSGFTRGLLTWGLVYALAFYLVHLVWSARGFRGDVFLLPALHLLTGVGLMMMVSLRDPLRDTFLFSGFALGVALGAAALLLLSQVDFQQSVWRRLAYVPLLLSFLLSLVLILFGSGPAGSDAKINLSLLGLTWQPVELIKILLVFFFAGYFAQRWELLRSAGAPPRLGERLARLNPKNNAALARFFGFLDAHYARIERPSLAYVLPLVVGVALTLGFFFLQKDLGPALIIACLFLALYGVARGRWLGAAFGLLLVVGAFWGSYQVGYPATVAQRLEIWLAPWSNEVAYGGNHLAHSFWGLASGGLTGLGPGQGSPALVPQAHTDFIFAAIGEELGLLGLLAVFALYGLLLWRAWRITKEAPGGYTFFLGLAVLFLTAFHLLLIGGGVLGVLPLSGVISPFLNLGKSSMVANFALFGMLASISAAAGTAPETERLRGPARRVLWGVGALVVVLVLRAGWLQVVKDEATMVRGVYTMEADGEQRLRHNPRLLQAAGLIPRGTLYDRNGLPLATSHPDALTPHADAFLRLGLDVSRMQEAKGRIYPLGDAAFHLLGDLNTRRNLAASNTSYLERDERAWLRGYEDLRELIPLVRYGPDHPDSQTLLRQERDLHLTLDARLQQRAANILSQQIEAAGLAKGAAVVLDAATGALLASVTYPYAGGGEALLDRPRYGVYPPGSTFKLVTATAALRKDRGADDQGYTCRALPGGGAGNTVKGWGRPIRDATGTAHGEIEMARAMMVSCNAYFAQLGTYFVGAQDLFYLLKKFGMEAGLPGEADSTQVARLKDALPQAAIGQGPVLATPLEIARVAATLANAGRMPDVHWVASDDAVLPAEPILPPEHAALLGTFMRSVVTDGTARALSGLGVPVAGKTGTAEVAKGRSHAWFTGFAPYGSKQQVAFAVVIENGGYGGQLAARTAGEIVEAAAELGLLSQ